MTLWRLEWLRLVRTRRWMAVLGAFLFFGFLGPLTAAYLPEIVSLAGGDLEGATIEFPPATPTDGLAQFVSNAVQIGTLVAVVVAAGALAVDAIPEMGVFLRTRVPDVRRLLAPRVAVTLAVVAGSWVLGSLVAWYESSVLIGPLRAGPVLLGIGFGVVFMAFVVSLVAAVAARARTVLGTVMVSIVVLLVLPVLGIVQALDRWLPSHLPGSLPALQGEAVASDYLPALSTTVLATVLLLWLAIVLNRRRES